jgi:hypothetical protein
MFLGSTLDEASVRPVPQTDGTTDLYIKQERFHAQFCADVPVWKAARMAATQRPATQEALTDPSGERSLWREVPGASHAITVSQPEATAQLILEAAAVCVGA